MHREEEEKTKSFCYWLDIKAEHEKHFQVITMIDDLFEMYLTSLTKPIRSKDKHKLAVKLFILNFASYRNSSGQLSGMTKKLAKHGSGYPSSNLDVNPYSIGRPIFSSVYDFFIRHFLDEKLGTNHSDERRGMGCLTKITSNTAFIRIYNERGISGGIVDRHSKAPKITTKDKNGKFKSISHHSERTTYHFINRFESLAGRSEIFNPAIGRISHYITRMFKPNNTSHGRFYGEWEQIPNTYKEKYSDENLYTEVHHLGLRVGDSIRALTTIDGEQTSEVDFKACFPNMLYHMKGLTAEGDPYEIDRIAEIKTPEEQRNTVKFAFQCLLNGKNAKLTLFNNRLEHPALEVKSVRDEIIGSLLEKHTPIAELISVEQIGNKLMYAESQIAMRVLNHFLKQKILCLPIHDSFLIKSQHKEELKQQMIVAYSAELKGFAPQVKVVF